MSSHIAGLDKAMQKVGGCIARATCNLPDNYRNQVIDGLLAAMTAAHGDPETTHGERAEIEKARERLLSGLADSRMKVRLEHGDEVSAVGEKNSVTRTKRRDHLALQLHKKAYMAEAERKYVPPIKGS